MSNSPQEILTGKMRICRENETNVSVISGLCGKTNAL